VATHTIAGWAVGLSLLSDGATALVAFRENHDDDYTTHAVLFGRDGQLLRRRTLDGLPMAYAGGTRGDGTGYFFMTAAPEGSLASLGSFQLDHELNVRRGLETFGPREGPYWFTSGDLAWDGSAYTFFYRSYITGLRMSRVAPDGRLLEDTALLPLPGSEWTSGLATAGGMGTTLLLYPASEVSFLAQETYILRLRAGHDAASLAAAPELALEHGAFEQTVPVAASSDTQSLVAWRERVSLTEPPRIYATRVLNGQVRDPQSLLLGTLSIAYPDVQLASDGEGFVAAWTDPEGIITRHIAADGTVGPKTVTRRISTKLQARALEVLSNGDGYLVAWVEDAIGLDRGYAVRLRADGTVIDNTPLDLGAVEELLAGASDGSGYMLAGRGAGVLISSAGKVTARPNLGVNIIPMAAWWNGTSYSIATYAWDSFNAYRVAQVSADGTVAFGNVWSWPGSVSWAWGWFDACGTAGCSLLRGTMSEGEYFLREERVSATGVAYGSSVQVQPAALRLHGNEMRGALFRVPGGRLMAAVERLVYQPPYAGISRIFIAPLDAPSRVRSVRH
jgi:hypothetical protein